MVRIKTIRTINTVMVNRKNGLGLFLGKIATLQQWGARFKSPRIIQNGPKKLLKYPIKSTALTTVSGRLGRIACDENIRLCRLVR
jgi:hypothetical protein